MKFLVVGLGNMGVEYDGTRHNVGFEVADQMTHSAQVNYEHESHGELALIKHRGKRIYVLKPSSYMNRSGKAVRYWMQKLKIPLENILIVVDEIQLPFGTYKLTKKGKDGGHNGLKDIQQMLQTPNYARLRIGIGRDFHKGQQVNYVLGKWSDEQQSGLEDIKKQCAEVALSFASIGADLTMTKYNGGGKGAKTHG